MKKWSKKFKFGNIDGDFCFDPKIPLSDPLLKAISRDLKIDNKYIYTSAGISQLISAILPLDRWEEIFLPSIEFGLYERTCILHNKKTTLINAFSTAEFLEELKTKNSSENSLLCISSPRWFTGEIFSLNQINEILSIFKGYIFIDEAYVDFSINPNHLVDLCMKNERIIIARSFSKKFIASGLRVGYLITKLNINGLRNTLIPPHSVSTHSISIIVKLLNDNKLLKSFDTTRKYIAENRDYIYDNLNGFDGIKIIKSSANFITLIFDTEEKMNTAYSKIKNFVGVNKYNFNNIFFIKIWIKNLLFSKTIVNNIIK